VETPPALLAGLRLYAVLFSFHFAAIIDFGGSPPRIFSSGTSVSGDRSFREIGAEVFDFVHFPKCQPARQSGNEPFWKVCEMEHLGADLPK
jgi:hypothetical protein